MADLIQREDSLNTGREKLNEAIKASERADVKSEYAVQTADAAKSTADTTREEMVEIIREQTNGGDIVPEVVQARGDQSTLGERLNSTEQQLAQKATKDEVDVQIQPLNKGLVSVTEDVIGRAINIMHPPVPLISAKGNANFYNETDGLWYEDEEFTVLSTDDTSAIQGAIDYANNYGRTVFVPFTSYLISNTIKLNGCSLIGAQGNIFNDNSKGACFIAQTKDFTAISQGSLSNKDIQFSVIDIQVKNAKIGFEFNYAINSKFERLYAKDCDIGYKLGDFTAVGSMFCEFNNLYTRGTRIGAIVQSNNYFNNNRFNNGWFEGSEKAFHLEVSGGYGAVNNVFNSVEFRSQLGRGIVISNNLNTTFNGCYFENGGNAIRALTFSSINVNECVFGLFKVGNTNGDKSFIFAEGGFRMKLDGGELFLTSENNNTLFYDANNPATHGTIYMNNVIRQNGSATNFTRFKQRINEIAYQKEEQVVNTSTVTVPSGSFADISFTYPVPFSRTPDVCVPTLRGSGFQGNTLYQAILTNSRADGGNIRIYNASSSTDREVYFSIYAKII